MRRSRRELRQMPKIYGNVQPRRTRSFAGFFRTLRIILITVLVGTIGYTVLASSVFQVRSVEVQGAVLADAEAAKALVPLGTSLWRIPKQAIERELLQVPTVLGVGVYRGLPDNVRIVIREREPVLSWVSNGKLYLIDSDGYAFSVFDQQAIPSIDTLPGQRITLLPQVRDTKNIAVELNTPIASRTFLNFIATMQTELSTHLSGVTLDYLEITDTTYDLTYVSQQGMRVQFNTLADAGVQVRNLTRLINEQKVNATTSNVDLRIDRWAYVR